MITLNRVIDLTICEADICEFKNIEKQGHLDGSVG